MAIDCDIGAAANPAGNGVHDGHAPLEYHRYMTGNVHDTDVTAQWRFRGAVLLLLTPRTHLAAAKIGRRRPGSPPRTPSLVATRIPISFWGSAASDAKRCIAKTLTSRSIACAQVNTSIFPDRSE